MLSIFTSENSILLVPAILSFIAALLSLSYNISSNSNKQKYERYHKLIDELVGTGQPAPMLDSQCAKAYELLFFRKYRKLTIRIFSNIFIGRHDPTDVLYIEMQKTVEMLKKPPIIWYFCYLLRDL